MTDSPSYEAAIARNESKAKAATKAMREAIINFDINEARIQLQTEKQANAAVRRLRARQAKKMSLADGISKVFDLMSPGSDMRLSHFINHVEITRGDLDDGAVLANLTQRLLDGDTSFEIVTLPVDGYRVRFIKKI